MFVILVPLHGHANVRPLMPSLSLPKQCKCECRCRKDFGRCFAHVTCLPGTESDAHVTVSERLRFSCGGRYRKGDYDYTKADYTGPICIIMGAEDKGVSYDNLALCDEWVKIPMLGTIESLNVSVAAGILVYEAVRQRLGNKN